MLPFALKLAIPVAAGALTAGLGMFGLVYSQTQVPDTNPASKPVLTYGDES